MVVVAPIIIYEVWEKKYIYITYHYLLMVYLLLQL